MAKNYKQAIEESSGFLSPVVAAGETERMGERAQTIFLSEAKIIDIERIKPNPNQPRKTFVAEKLQSLAESIRELGGIIDPLTVEYDEQEDCFRIMSGERRYRAAKIVGLTRLPCIIKDVNEEKRLLFQLIANLQREDISALEESDGIRSLIEKFGYSQIKVAKLLNKSKSYISQVLGLERLSKPARVIVQTSELSKEILIRASREKDHGKQLEILKKSLEEGKTVRQIRSEEKMAGDNKVRQAGKGISTAYKKDETILTSNKSSEWTWGPEDGRFVLTISFDKEYSESEEIQMVKAALEEACKYLRELYTTS